MIRLLVLPSLVALVLLAGLVTLAVLLTNPKTRVAGVVILSTLVVMAAVAFGVHLFTFTGVRYEAEQEWAVESQDVMPDRHATGAMARAEASRRTIPLESTEAVTAEAPGQTKDVLRALLNSLGKAVADTKEKDKLAKAAAAGGTIAPRAAAAEDQPAANRPAWVDEPSELVLQDLEGGKFSIHFKYRKGDAYWMTVQIEPRRTLQQCESELPLALNKAAVEYAIEKLNRRPRFARQMQLPADFLKQNIVKETWPEPVQVSLGDWTQLHVLLEFDQAARARIDQECDKFVVAGRLWYTGTGVVTGLALLAVLFGVLKIDQATAGSCRVRLGLAAVVAALAVIAGASMAVDCAPAPSMTAETPPSDNTLVLPANHTASKIAGAEAPGAFDAVIPVPQVERDRYYIER